MNHKFPFLFRAALSALLLSSMAGCEVLEQDPPTALTPADTFSTPDRIAKAAIGMYDFLQNAEFLGGRALIYSDVRSDDTDPSPFFNSVANFNQLPNDVNATNAWTGGYRTIYGANYFLQNLEANPGKTTPELEAQYIGEAKYIRALTLFHLVNLFAQPYRFTADASHLGVPIQLIAPNATSAFDPSQQLSRSSVREVYAQIEKDLTEALPSLPETYPGVAPNIQEKVARATKDAVRALLSRVYLYKGDYTNAALYAGQVVSGNRHTLNSDPAAPFRAATYTSSESIFSVAMNSADNPNTNNALGQHYGSARRADITIDPYVAVVPAGDKRRTNLTISANGKSYTTKYLNSSFDYVPISRYSEVLLNRSEALARGSSTISAEAITLLNLVRDRSKPTTAPSYTVASFANAQALIDAILFERRLELAFEGHRFYDLLRTRQPGQTVVPSRGSSPAQVYGSNLLVFPIPLVDIQQNLNLVQNPGY